MNLIGIFGPKILVLLAIWLPPYDLSNKLLLSLICGGKLIWDFDRCKPGHKGLAYRLSSRFCIDTQEIIIGVITFCISLLFGVATICKHAWIPAVCGIISVVFSIYELVGSIKDAVVSKKSKPHIKQFQVSNKDNTIPVPTPHIPPVPVMPQGNAQPIIKPPRTIIPLAKLKKSFKKEENKYYKKRFSVLGDSIGTLEGFNPLGYNVLILVTTVQSQA